MIIIIQWYFLWLPWRFWRYRGPNSSGTKLSTSVFLPWSSEEPWGKIRKARCMRGSHGFCSCNQWIGLRENWNRKAPYLMGNSMVSCKFSLKPIHWCNLTSQKLWILPPKNWSWWCFRQKETWIYHEKLDLRLPGQTIFGGGTKIEFLQCWKTVCMLTTTHDSKKMW